MRQEEFKMERTGLVEIGLIDAGIDGDRIQLKPANEFYDL